MTGSHQLFHWLRRSGRMLAAAAVTIGVSLGAPVHPSAQAAGVPQQLMGDGGTIRLAGNANSTQVWHLAAISKYHLDTKYGFKLQMVQASNRQMTQSAMQSGAADLGMYSWIDLIRMRNAGVDIVGVVPFLRWGTNQIVVPIKSTAKSLPDLKGKKFGTASISDIDWFLVRSLASSKYHMDPDKDLDVQSGSIGLIRGLLESGQLDGGIMWNDQTPVMVADKSVRVIYQLRDIISTLGLPQTPMLMYGVTGSYAAAHPQNVRAFAAAYREAIQDLKKDNSVWNEVGKQREMSPDAIAGLRDEMRRDLMPSFAPTVQADIKKVFDYLRPSAGPDVFGFTDIPNDYLTLKFQ